MCENCKNQYDCLLYGKIGRCPNFKSKIEKCKNCINTGNCFKEQFFDWCENFKLNKKVVKNG